MQKLFFLLLFLAPLLLSAQTPTVVDPHTFPEETNPQESNFEFYSRKLGLNKRASFNNVRKRMLAIVRQPNNIAYTPTPTGNANDRGSLVKTSTGRIYYIDGLGNALWLNQEFVEAYGSYDNDEDAALSCVPINGKYRASETNTMGASPGDLRVRIYGGSPPCIE